MITRLSHAIIYVLDQGEALAFYRDKLGFEVRTDLTMDGGFRWLTVGPKTQPDLEIILMGLTDSPMCPPDKIAAMRQLVAAGVVCGGILAVDDCQKTYEELKAKGVEFMSPPEERPHGVEAMMKDNSGNWFSVSQPKDWKGAPPPSGAKC